jgi:hypothetical protein
MVIRKSFPLLFNNGMDGKLKFLFTNHVVPLILFTIITLVMVLLPNGLDLAGKYIGTGEVVFWSNYFWWFDYSITYLFVNPLHDPYLFYPLGLDMVDSVFPLIFFVPFTHIFGSIVSYNLYVLSTFILAGYGMFILSRYLLGDTYIAFISGLIFTFCPFHFGSAFGHIHTFSIMWIPFFVLFFLKMYEQPTFSHAIICGIFFAINALTSWTIAIMIIIFILIFLFINHTCLLEKKYFLCFIIFTVVSFIIMSPGLYIILYNYIFNPDMVKPLGDFIIYSSDPLAFIVPSPVHPLLGSLTQGIYSQFTGNYSENIMFIGYSVIILSVFGLITCRKKPIFHLFAISFIVFLILSLGPVFHFNGTWKFTDDNLTFLLPGIITYYLPVFNMIRAPSRYDIMVMFCLAIIAGFGLKVLIKKYAISSRRKIIFCTFISLIILCEYAAVIPTQAVMPIPEFYSNISYDKDFSIIEIPFCSIDSPSSFDTMSRYYEYQKTHHGKLFGGYWSRITPSYNEFIESDPIIYHLNSGSEDIINSSIENPLFYLNKKYDVKYVIIHTSITDNKSRNEIIQYLGNSYVVDNSVSSDPLIIYPVTTTNGFNYTTPENIIRLDFSSEGWHGNEDWDGIPTRWMNGNATILINRSTNRSGSLHFQAQSWNNTRTVEIYSGNRLVSNVSIPQYLIPVNVTVPLKYGENSIRFYVSEGCMRPIDLPEMNSKDSRCLSIAIQNITID